MIDMFGEIQYINKVRVQEELDELREDYDSLERKFDIAESSSQQWKMYSEYYKGILEGLREYCRQDNSELAKTIVQRIDKAIGESGPQW